MTGSPDLRERMGIMPEGSSAPDLVAIEGATTADLGSGDYTQIGSWLVWMSELLCEAVDPHPG